MAHHSEVEAISVRVDANAWARRASNFMFEALFGIATRGIVETRIPDAHVYATVDYGQIRKVLGALTLQPDDRFVDVGCGRGRVLCCAARHQLAGVAGVELSAQLCADARANARQMRGCKTPILVHEIAAQDFDYGGTTVLYFFNPFGAATLDLMLGKLRVDTEGSRVRLAFVNIAPHTAEVFRRHEWLRRDDLWAGNDRGVHPVGFYSRAA